MAGTQAKSRLAEIREALSENPDEPQRFTVREILHWFGYRRRARLNLRDIRNTLRSTGLTTDPDLNAVHIDSMVSFRAKDQASGDPEDVNSYTTSSTSQVRETAPASTPTEVEEQADDSADIANLVSRLRSANREVTSVTPSDTIAKAVTTMLLNDYSQLPVISGKTTVKGMISWQSIGHSLSQGVQPDKVQDCMTRAYREVRSDSRLLDVVDEIVDNGAVLVRGNAPQILGIITMADLSEEFKKLAETFLQIGEIEQHLRNLMGHLSSGDLQKVADPSDNKPISDISDLTLGEIIRLFQNPETWETVALKLDRKVLISHLEEVREIRNEVMHFNPDGLDESQLESLRRVSKMLHNLRELPRRQGRGSSAD